MVTAHCLLCCHGLSNHGRVPSTVNEKLTTAAPTVDKKLEFSNSNCGKTENCHSLPSDCSSSSDCEYLVTFKPCDDNGTVSFELSGKSDWVAIGFNNKSKMDGTEAIICSRLNDTAVIIKHYALVGHNSPIQTNPDPLGMTVKSSAYDDGIIRCRFSLNKNASKVLQLNQKVFLIFARGSVNQGGTLSKHSYKSVSDSQVDVCELERKTPFLLRVHGALMIMAWMGFGFLALSVMTFKKMAPGNPCGKVSWFQICKALTVVCLLFTLAGFVVAFVHFGGWSDGLQKLSMVDSVPGDRASKIHSVLGCITAFFICVVVILWLFMPATYLESRNVFRRCFGLVAVVTFSLAIFSLLVGFPMAGMLQFFFYFVIAYSLNMVPVLVLVCCLRDRMDGGPDDRICGITSKRFVNMTFMFNFTVVIAVSLTLLVSLSDTNIMRLRLD